MTMLEDITDKYYLSFSVIEYNIAVRGFGMGGCGGDRRALASLVNIGNVLKFNSTLILV